MRIIIPLLLALLVSLPACGDSHESCAEDMIDVMNEVADTLEDVDDEDSAEDARDDIKDLIKEMGEIKDRMEELGDPGKSEEKELDEEYGEDLKKASQRMMRAMTGLLATDYGRKELTEIFTEMQGAMR